MPAFFTGYNRGKGANLKHRVLSITLQLAGTPGASNVEFMTA